MKLIGTRKCRKRNRSEKTKSIVEALKCSGQVRLEYFKARLWGMNPPLGHPAPVRENDEWNLVKVTYKERDAFEIFYSRFGCSGHFYHENFDEAENQEIVDALAGAEVHVLELYMRLRRWLRLTSILFVFVALLLVINGFIYSDQETINKFSFLILLYLIIIWMTYWDRIWF